MMNTRTTFATLMLFSSIAFADPPSPENSSTQTGINVNVDDKTKKIKIITANNDSKIVSKVYKLKHVDPWELKPILDSAVGAKRNNKSRTGVECIKYKDGTGALIVTAEKYRFSNEQGGGMSIDELIKALDQPRGEVVEGMKSIVYFPKHRNAAAIAKMINNIGIKGKNDKTELLSGDSKALVDRELNAVIIKATPSEIKDLEKILQIYDKKTEQSTLSYKVYELYEEDEEAIGNDYLAWKKGPGAHLFSIAGKFSKGETTKFIQFNPKWNSTFLDYLSKEKKAVKLTSGRIILRNGKRYNSVNSNNPDKTGLNILVLPSIYRKTTTLDMKLVYISENSSSSLSTKVQISNDGGKVILGGLEKKSKVSSSTSPGMLDWLIGGSSDTINTSKIVIVIELNPSSPDSKIPAEAKKVIDEVKKELDLD